MTTVAHGPNVNLEELRHQLASRLALALVVVGCLLVLLTWPLIPSVLPSMLIAAVPAMALIGLGGSVRALVGVRPAMARHLLIWGLTAALLVAMWLSNASWLPFLGLMLAFISALLVSGGEFATAGMVALLATWLAYREGRPYALPELLIALALGAALAWLAVRTLYTALEWAWTMQQRADHLLEVARDRQGELNRVLKSLDLTNALLRRTQRELIVARRQADEARLMKEQFAANVSHELRTPLNLIMGFSEMMYLSSEVYGGMEWPLTLRQDIYQIYSSSQHLREMINDVLDLSRFEIVGFTLNRKLTSPERLLRDTVEIAEDLFRDRPILLAEEIAPDLPALEIDHTRVRQVLLNLLNNAARFTQKGMVRVEAKLGDGEVVISVSDTGPGIPADRLPHLFEEFYQADGSLSRRYGGAGLGLAISKRFVEAHGGRIWVESQEGAGSTFCFTLPIPGQHAPFSRLRVDRPLEPSRPETRAPILVVDPDPAVADLVRRRIEEYDVVPIGEVDQLAQEVTLHHPQMVVYNVPPWKQRGCSDFAPMPVPVVECSLPSQAWVANDLSVAACLTKPITAASLLREIGRLGHPRDILIVDDDWGFCQLVERMLGASDRAYVVRRAYDGEDGLRALRARRPELVLLDLVMPDVDGFQLLEEMRQDAELSSVPVVLLTATSYAEDVLTQRGSQFTIHRQDGLSPAEVLRCLKAVAGALEPHYDERAAPEEILVTSPSTDAMHTGHHPG